MAPCEATTKKGLPCRQRAKAGSRFCHVHEPRLTDKDLKASDVTDDMMRFVDDAIRDMATLALMRSQYCPKALSTPVRKQMDRLTERLDRIVQGSRDKKIPGLLAQVLSKTLSAQSLVALRRKFVDTFQQLTALLTRHCRVQGSSFRIPDLNLKVVLPQKSVSGKCGGEEVPTDMMEWLATASDEDGWKDKQILCLWSDPGEGRAVSLPEGFVLPDDFMVVRNHRDRWYGVARRRDAPNDTWYRVLQALRTGTEAAIKYLTPIMKAAWHMIRLVTQGVIRVTPTVARWVLRYWKEVLTIIAVAVVAKNPKILMVLPKTLLRAAFGVLQSAIQVLKSSSSSSLASKHVASWIVRNVGEACEGSQRLLLAPPPPKLLLAPPPPQTLKPDVSADQSLWWMLGLGAVSAVGPWVQQMVGETTVSTTTLQWAQYVLQEGFAAGYF